MKQGAGGVGVEAEDRNDVETNSGTPRRTDLARMCGTRFPLQHQKPMHELSLKAKVTHTFTHTTGHTCTRALTHPRTLTHPHAQLLTRLLSHSILLYASPILTIANK